MSIAFLAQHVQQFLKLKLQLYQIHQANPPETLPVQQLQQRFEQENQQGHLETLDQYLQLHQQIIPQIYQLQQKILNQPELEFEEAEQLLQNLQQRIYQAQLIQQQFQQFQQKNPQIQELILQFQEQDH